MTMNEEQKPLTSLRTGIPMDLERIVNKALAKDPDNRYQHLDELIVDLKNVKFIPETHGVIDNGANWNYYAPNTLQKDDGRRILFGWIPGFKKEQGWQGAISLPRDLSINDLGRLIQKPVSELTNLRGDLLQKTDVTLNNKPFEIEIAKPQFEMLFELKGEGTDNIGFKFNEESGNPYKIMLTPGKFIIGEDNISVDSELGEKIKTIQLFFDRTVIEIFVNDGLACATKVIYPDKDKLNFEIIPKLLEGFIDEQEHVLHNRFAGLGSDHSFRPGR